MTMSSHADQEEKRAPPGQTDSATITTTTRSSTPSQHKALVKKTSSTDSSKWKIHDTPQDSGLLPTIAVTLWLGWNGIVILILIYLLLIANKWERLVIIGLCTLSLILPAEFPGKWGYRLGDWMMFQAEKYFGLKTVVEDEEELLRASDQNKAVIFAFEPHDILPYAVFAFSPTLRRLPGKIGEDGCCLMSSAIFSIPFIRQIYSWVRCLPVDKRTFMGRLKRGESFAFVPGGVQEVIMLDPSTPSDLVLYLRNRKGFVKLALATGSPIVPVFAFNLDGSYGYWIPRGRFMEKISRSIGYLPLLFWGRWFVPFGIPNPKKIHVVIGPVIDVPNEGDGVAPELVDKYHAIFLEELEALFERHKHEAGYADRQLKIV